MQKNELMRDFLLSYLNKDILEIESLTLTSAQKARIAGWCEENEVQIPDLNNPKFFKIVEDDKEQVSVNSLQEGKNKTVKSNSDSYLKSETLAIGVDIQSISEFLPKEKINKSSEGLDAIFSKKEISYCENKKNPRQSLTGIFALKEAIFKANNSVGSNFNEIEINLELGEPRFEGFSLSLSYSKDFAIAVALDLSASGLNIDVLENRLLPILEDVLRHKI
tara:strand:+ start:111 stop:773 length:663 start_codon:yes stop_codon:yes gene_type:complete